MQYCDNVPSGNSMSSVPSANWSVMRHDSGTNVLTVLYLVVLVLHIIVWYLPYTCLQDMQLTIQTLRQEISEVKDVHKRLYDFLIESVAGTK